MFSNTRNFFFNLIVLTLIAVAFAGCKGKSGGGGGFTPAPATGPTSQLTINPLSVDSSGLYHVTGKTESLTGGSPSAIAIFVTVNGQKFSGGGTTVGNFDKTAVAQKASDVQVAVYPSTAGPAFEASTALIATQAVTALSGELTKGGQPFVVKFGGGE